MRYWTNENRNSDGTLTVETVSWAREDYEAAIAGAEAEITPRRLREAVLTEEGRAWLTAKEADIAALRVELNAV